MSFAVHVQNNGDFVTLRCIGRLVFDEGTNALRAAVIAQKARQLVLDLSCMEAIDAAGVGTLILLHQHVADAGRDLIVTQPKRHVLDVLRLTKADAVLNLQIPHQNAITTIFNRAMQPWRSRTCVI